MPELDASAPDSNDKQQQFQADAAATDMHDQHLATTDTTNEPPPSHTVTINHDNDDDSLHSPTKDAVSVDIDPALAAAANDKHIDSNSNAAIPPPQPIRTISEPVTNVQYSTRRIMTVYCALFCCISISALDTTIVTVAAPSITAEFGSFGAFGWVSAAYLATRAGCTPLYGRLSDRYGRRTLMMTALLLFSVGSIVSATAQSMFALIMGRAIQGTGGAGLGSLVQTVVGDMVAPQDRGKYAGPLQSAFGIFSVAGPVLGGVIVTNISWRWIFWINLPICGVTATVIFLLVKIPITDPNGKLSDLDFAGSICILTAVITLILALTWGGVTYAWVSYQVLVPLCVSAVAFIVFPLIEWTQKGNAITPLDMFRERNFSVSIAAIFMNGATLFGLIAYLPNYFQIVYGDSAAISGIRQVPLMAFFIIASVTVGQLISRTGGKGYKCYPIAGSAIALVATSILAAIFKPGLSYWTFAVLLGVEGIGVGCVQPVQQVVISNSVPLRRLAAATTAGSCMMALGGSIGISIVAVVLTNTYQSRLETLFAAGSLGPVPLNAISFDRATIETFPPATQHAFEDAYTDAMQHVFFVVLAYNSVLLLMTPWVKNVKLRAKKTRLPSAKQLTDGTESHYKEVTLALPSTTITNLSTIGSITTAAAVNDSSSPAPLQNTQES